MTNTVCLLHHSHAQRSLYLRCTASVAVLLAHHWVRHVRPDMPMELAATQVQWQGADAKGQPILVLQPAAVLSQPKPPPMELCAEAVISQVHAGIRNLVAHDCDPASSGMLVVVMDARGISGMQVCLLQPRSSAMSTMCMSCHVTAYSSSPYDMELRVGLSLQALVCMVECTLLLGMFCSTSI